MFELSCTLSPNDRHRNTETACQLFDSNSDPNLRGQGLPDSVELQQWTYFSVQDVLEDAMFSTASWIRLFCTFTFFFLFSLAFPLKGLTFVCLSFTRLQNIIQRMYIGREPGMDLCLCCGLCRALPNWSFWCKRWSLTEKFGVAKVYCNWTSTSQ